MLHAQSPPQVRTVSGFVWSRRGQRIGLSGFGSPTKLLNRFVRLDQYNNSHGTLNTRRGPLYWPSENQKDKLNDQVLTTQPHYQPSAFQPTSRCSRSLSLRNVLTRQSSSRIPPLSCLQCPSDPAFARGAQSQAVASTTHYYFQCQSGTALNRVAQLKVRSIHLQCQFAAADNHGEQLREEN